MNAFEQDLVPVLRRVPRLLEACVLDDLPSLRALRLVCKEASQVALRGLTSFTVELIDGGGYAQVNAARMVRQTQLTELKVSLPWLGEFEWRVIPSKWRLTMFKTLPQVENFHHQKLSSEVSTHNRCTHSLGLFCSWHATYITLFGFQLHAQGLFKGIYCMSNQLLVRAFHCNKHVVGALRYKG